MLKDLKAFLLRGNVVDLAVGVIIATAFGAIITSFVNDIITPLLLNPALEAAKVQNIAELAWNLRKKEEVAEEAPAGPTELEVLQEIKALLEKK